MAMKREVMNDDITGLRRAFPDFPWDSPESLNIQADIASFIQFVIDAREIRRAQGLTQKTMAERMETTQSCVSDFERIGGDPRIHTIQRYARAMGYRARLVLEKIPEDSAK